jgi:toxin secretion/phage lysis holin
MDGSGRMLDMFHYMQRWLENDNTKVIYVLVLILISNMIDFVAGWINAKFNPNVPFSSSKAIFGIARKMIMFILCVLFVPYFSFSALSSGNCFLVCFLIRVSSE